MSQLRFRIRRALTAAMSSSITRGSRSWMRTIHFGRVNRSGSAASELATRHRFIKTSPTLPYTRGIAHESDCVHRGTSPQMSVELDNHSRGLSPLRPAVGLTVSNRLTSEPNRSAGHRGAPRAPVGNLPEWFRHPCRRSTAVHRHRRIVTSSGGYNHDSRL